MFLGGLEVFLIKGIGYLVTHASASAVAHGLGHLATYAVAHGVVATAIALAPIVITGTVIIGGVVWTQEKANRVNKLVNALRDNDAEEAGKQLLKLSDILGLTIDETVVNVGELLDQNYDKKNVKQVRKTIEAIAGEIKKTKK